MDRRTRNLFAILLVVVIAVTGGAALIFGGSGTKPEPSSLPRSFMTGVVVAVDARSLTDVRSFDLRISPDAIRTFGLANLENGVEFPPGHLNEHMATASPIRVYYRVIDGVNQAIRIEDAPSS